MKNHLLPFAIVVLLGSATIGCQKSDHPSSSSTHPQISVSQSTVARGQQLSLTVQNLSGSAMIKWNVLPAKGTKVIAEKNEATAFFANQGNYQVKAAYYADSSAPLPYDSSSTPVMVSDSVYNPPPPTNSPDSTIPLYDDTVHIEPITATDTGGFILYLQTSRSYPCNARLNYSYIRSDTAIIIHIGDITIDKTNCNNPSTTAKAYIINPPLPIGVYNLYIATDQFKLGTLTVTDQTYTFDWPNQWDIILSPTQIPAK